MTIRVPFCRPDYESGELEHLADAVRFGRLEGGGPFTRACEQLLEADTGSHRALITPSCTAALEMMALLLDIRPGDEVVMPAYTFVSTANAIALRGGVPVFAEIDPATLNLDPDAAAAAITSRTRAIMLVHYAGVGCEMEAFQSLASKHGLALLEDAAQALGARWNGRALGSFGRLGAFSFHHTKNVACGEGGALLVNDERDRQRADYVRDKGTDRADFLRGERSKYEWRELGSSYLLSELAAAMLQRQLERRQSLLEKRLARWTCYDRVFSSYADLVTPHIPKPASHNAHIYHLRLPEPESREAFIAELRSQGIIAAAHYVALHDTPGGQKLARSAGDLPHTRKAAETLVRLPLYSAMTDGEQDIVINAAMQALHCLDLR